MKIQVTDLRINLMRLHFGLRLHFHSKRKFDLSNITWRRGYFQLNPHFWIVEPNVYISCVKSMVFDVTASIDFKKEGVIKSYRFHPCWKKASEIITFENTYYTR